jgi:hypothetical protein
MQHGWLSRMCLECGCWEEKICNMTVYCFGVTDKTDQESAADLWIHQWSQKGYHPRVDNMCFWFVLRLMVVATIWLIVVIDDNPLHLVLHPAKFVLLVIVLPLSFSQRSNPQSQHLDIGKKCHCCHILTFSPLLLSWFDGDPGGWLSSPWSATKCVNHCPVSGLACRNCQRSEQEVQHINQLWI